MKKSWSESFLFRKANPTPDLHEDKGNSSSSSSSPSSKRLYAKGPARKPQNFVKLKLLGKGDVGRVYLVKDVLDDGKSKQRLFAMKILSKAEMLSRNKIHRVLTEQKLMLEISHPFIVSMYFSFQSPSHLFLCLEYLAGGEFFRMLQTRPTKRLTEPEAKFYAAEVVSALEYLHLSGFIYRDLKPENILVHISGHIKLADFDLCKSSDFYTEPTIVKNVSLFHSRRKSLLDQIDTKSTANIKTNSFVGTEEYMAPEVIKAKGHSSAVDWWTLGIFIYEMLTSVTPFRAKSQRETFGNIIKKEPDLSKLQSNASKSLVRKLLVKNPDKRLGSKFGAIEIKLHQFFKKTKWALLMHESPPLIPRLSSPLDTKYFKEFPRDDQDENGDEIPWANENEMDVITQTSEDFSTMSIKITKPRGLSKSCSLTGLKSISDRSSSKLRNMVSSSDLGLDSENDMSEAMEGDSSTEIDPFQEFETGFRIENKADPNDVQGQALEKVLTETQQAQQIINRRSEAAPSPTLSEISVYAEKTSFKPSSNSTTFGTKKGLNYRHTINQLGHLRSTLMRHVSYSSPLAVPIQGNPESPVDIDMTHTANSIESPTKRKLSLIIPEPPIPSILTLVPQKARYLILSLLPLQDVIKCSQVCLSWYGIIYDQDFWFYLCDKNGWTTEIPSRLKDLNWSVLYRDRSEAKENIRQGKYSLIEVNAHSGPVYCVNCENEQVITAGKDGYLLSWLFDFDSDSNIGAVSSHDSIENINADHHDSILHLRHRIESVKSLDFFQFDEFESEREKPLRNLAITALTALDGSYIVGGLEDGSILFWNRHTLELDFKMNREHADAISGLKPIGNDLLVSTSFDSTSRWYRLNNYYKEGIQSARVSKDELYTATGKFSIKLSHVERCQAEIYCFEFLSDSQSVAFGLANGSFCLKAVENPNEKMIRIIKAHSGSVTSLKHFKGSLVSAGMDQAIKWWNLIDDRCYQVFNLNDIPRSLGSSDDFLIVGKSNGVEVYDCEKMKKIQEFLLSNGKKLMRLDATPFEIFVGCHDGNLLIFDLLQK